MESTAQNTRSNVQPKKEWVSPKLKKISIEQITAGGPLAGGDGGSRS